MPNQKITNTSRVVNLFDIIDSTKGTDNVRIYQPGILNVADKMPNVRYFGSISPLKMYVDIPSLSELTVAIIDPLDTLDMIAEKNREAFFLAEKIELELLIGKGSAVQKLTSLYLFNQRPFYYLNLLPFLGNSTFFNCANDTSIYLRLVTALDVGDSLRILGTAIESGDFISDIPEPVININLGGIVTPPVLPTIGWESLSATQYKQLSNEQWKAL